MYRGMLTCLHRNKHNRFKLMLFLLFTLCLVTGCLGEEYDEEEIDSVIEEGEENASAIKIYIGSDINSHTAGARQYHFSKLLRDYLEEHMPEQQFIYAFEFTWGEEISREVLFDVHGDSEDPEPDIIIDYPHQIPFLLEEGFLEYDKLSLSEMYDIDLSMFDSVFLDQLLAPGDGTLYAFPLIRSLHGIKYNKDAFDELGLDYPTDDMLWQDILDWSDQLEDFSLSIESRYLLHQLSSTYSDILETENRRILEDVAYIYEHYPPYYSSVHKRVRGAFGETVQLFSTVSRDYFPDRIEWDLAAYPVFDVSHRRGPDHVTDMIAVTPHTKNFDIAFEVMLLLLSEDFQAELSRVGHGSPLDNLNIHQQFGMDVLYFQGKNTEALFRNRPAVSDFLKEEEIEAEALAHRHFSNIHFGEDREIVLKEMIEDLKNRD